MCRWEGGGGEIPKGGGGGGGGGGGRAGRARSLGIWPRGRDHGGRNPWDTGFGILKQNRDNPA